MQYGRKTLIHAKRVRWLLAPILLALATMAYPARPLSRPSIAGILTDPRLPELSGLAFSQISDDHLWAINDGGNPNVLILLNRRGRVLREVAAGGALNTDWEDLAAVRWKGRHYLLIADTGDNSAQRDFVTLWLIEEPNPRMPKSVPGPARRLDFRYPQGPRDVESMTVDPVSGDIFLLSKRTVPTVLYRLNMSDFDEPSVKLAERLTALGGIEQPTEREIRRDGALSRFRSQTTAMTLDCSGRGLLVLTYSAVYRYQRDIGQSWQDALTAQTPSKSVLSLLPQAEAMALDPECNNLYIGSERVPVPLLRFRYRPVPVTNSALE